MDSVALTPLEHTDAIEQAFLGLCESIDGVDAVKDYRPAPDEPIENNIVCCYFDWEAEDAHTTRGARASTTVDWSWRVAVIVHGYDPRDMQRSVKAIVLSIREALRGNRTLGRGADGRALAKNGVELTNAGPPLPFNINNAPGIAKEFRLTVERQV